MAEHYPVMKEYVVQYLNLKDGGIYVDATCGYGGHSRYILETNSNIFLYGLDKDEEAFRYTSQALANFKNFKAIHSGYEDIDQVLEKEGIEKVDGILMDLGFSTNQVKDGERGFSFQIEGPLDMRYDRRNELTAGEIINKWNRKEMIWVFEQYGEIKRAHKIVDAIIEQRKKKRFETTTELADFITKYYRRYGKIHPATKFFMALRIAVNNELEILKEGLKKAVILLKTNGRLVVISFHSLEDRLVKHFFRNNQQLKVLTRKPLLPEEKEVDVNPESRSAKMRVCEKI
ncbi:MAG TPA: 16S rRNA (cytosine(1402)-N(4))-methyltransferase RsmH [bacterium]|nr:16S rRNA (cytosine(1402)-N(4))-methyltransferase RsmH [bacterium]HPP30443.1 16S rRNA (cytosine(1402)-N(4))-methyltransferase RsmH [bacterium]